MKCPEKQALQEQCTAAWEAYAAEAARVGLAVNLNGGIPLPTPSGLSAKASNLPETWGDAYTAAMRLRGQHMAASRELSRHLTRHRC
ncbi:hypothetical protein SBA3_3780015 [Candidatus Sulfopaludibacter sp. SbA3]|nr:hypothetical protein SBA3_3780015 [Candidatus Sulfopaludibacter sp. SbA3]